MDAETELTDELVEGASEQAEPDPAAAAITAAEARWTLADLQAAEAKVKADIAGNEITLARLARSIAKAKADLAAVEADLLEAEQEGR